MPAGSWKQCKVRGHKTKNWWDCQHQISLILIWNWSIVEWRISKYSWLFLTWARMLACVHTFVQEGFWFWFVQCAWLLCICARIMVLCICRRFLTLCLCICVRILLNYICARILACVYLCKGGLALGRDATETEQGLSGGAVDDWGRQTRTEKLYFCVLQYTWQYVLVNISLVLMVV